MNKEKKHNQHADKIVVGAKVWIATPPSLVLGRRNDFSTPIEATIKKVGSKYFYVEEFGWSETKVDKETLFVFSEFSNSRKVYFVLEEFEIELQVHKLSSKLAAFFGSSNLRTGLTLEQLRAIDAIINPPATNPDLVAMAARAADPGDPYEDYK